MPSGGLSALTPASCVQEDEKLAELHRRHGNKWTEIARMIGGRTDNAVKNRYHALVRKDEKAKGHSSGSLNNSSELSDDQTTYLTSVSPVLQLCLLQPVVLVRSPFVVYRLVVLRELQRDFVVFRLLVAQAVFQNAAEWTAFLVVLQLCLSRNMEREGCGSIAQHLLPKPYLVPWTGVKTLLELQSYPYLNHLRTGRSIGFLRDKFLSCVV